MTRHVLTNGRRFPSYGQARHRRSRLACSPLSHRTSRRSPTRIRPWREGPRVSNWCVWILHHRTQPSIPFPSANLPSESITPLETAAGIGVYYGYAQIVPDQDTAAQFLAQDTQVLPMVMSLGWNPFYKNEQKTAVMLSLASTDP